MEIKIHLRITVSGTVYLLFFTCVAQDDKMRVMKIFIPQIHHLPSLTLFEFEILRRIYMCAHDGNYEATLISRVMKSCLPMSVLSGVFSDKMAC